MLTKILGYKDLKDINNPHILNLKERTFIYFFHIRYRKGKINHTADALPQYPTLLGHPEESDVADKLLCAIRIAAVSEVIEDDEGRVVDLQQVEEEAAEDEEYQLLLECVPNDGWTDCKDMMLLTLQPYFRMWCHVISGRSHPAHQ